MLILDFTNEYQLLFAAKEYLEYWNHCRFHAGLDGKMALPYPQGVDGEMQEILFRGGMFR